MLVTSSIDELMQAQTKIEDLKESKPTLYKQCLNIIRLTRQLQFGFQYMGCLLMDEDPGAYKPASQDDYVLAVYKQEINKLKSDGIGSDIKALLATFKSISYPIFCKLMLGAHPRALVGPTVVR